MSPFQLPFAEDVNYWQSGKSPPDAWIDRTKALVKGLGGVILMDAFGSDASGRAAFAMQLEIGGEQYKVIWPVLPSRTKNERAARIQAATMLYHDVKQRCLSAVVLGARAAFFSYLVLPDGRTAAEVATPELADSLPALLRAKNE